MALKRFALKSAAHICFSTVPKTNTLPVPALVSTANARMCFSTVPKTKSLPASVSNANTRMCFSTVPNTALLAIKKSLLSNESHLEVEAKLRSYLKSLYGPECTIDQMKRGYIKACQIIFDVDDDSDNTSPKLIFRQEGFHVFMGVSGFKNKELNLEVKNGHLTVNGETKTLSGPKKVHQVIKLPENHQFNPLDVTATIVSGELKVTFPVLKNESKESCFSVVNWV